MADYTFQIGARAVTLDVVCLWCGASLEDGRIESGYTGGPDWGSADSFTSDKERKPGTLLDYGCWRSPSTGEDGTGSHAPNVMVTWDALLIQIPALAGSVLAAAVELTDDNWTTTLPAPDGLLPVATVPTCDVIEDGKRCGAALRGTLPVHWHTPSPAA